MHAKLAFLISLTLLSFRSNSQYALANFDLSDSAEHWFDTEIGLQAHDIFIGVYESLEGRPAIEQASWGSNTWSVGNIFYRGEGYKNIYLFYDQESDVLFTKNHLNSAYFNQPIKLNQQQIEWFSIGNDLFRRTSFPSLNALPGFYQELYRSETFCMYVKRVKVRKLDVNAVKLESDDAFYIAIKGAEHKVHGRASFYKIFPEFKRDLKPIFKSLRIRKLQNASTYQLEELAHRLSPIITRS